MSSRQMRLTAELVAQVPPLAGEPGPMPEGLVRPTDADYEAVVQRILDDRPASGEVWIFAYGSLIWNPAFASVEERIGTALGWHRAFCLGWTRIFRASPDRPGLMLALDRGGACKGVAYRLPSDAVEESLGKLVRREMPFKPSPLPARWVSVRMAYGAIEVGPKRTSVNRVATSDIGPFQTLRWLCASNRMSIHLAEQTASLAPKSHDFDQTRCDRHRRCPPLGGLAMNPLAWKREHQLALAIAIVIGAAIGIVVGYFAYAAEMGIASTSFGNWLKGPFRFRHRTPFLLDVLYLAPLWWGLFGGAIGAGVLYVRRLTAK